MEQLRIPFIVFGDGPRLHSGLGRIARDLAVRLYTAQDELGIRLLQVGVDPPGGWHFQAWDFYGFHETTAGFGRPAMETVVAELEDQGAPKPVILCLTDPSRVYDLTRLSADVDDDPLTKRAHFWGYFPIDSENLQGAIGGPASEAVWDMDRILAYGTYGARVLQRTVQIEMDRRLALSGFQTRGATHQPARIQHLPHGLEPGLWAPIYDRVQTDDDFQRWLGDFPGMVVGAVATNQPRKDLGLLFQVVADMKVAAGRLKFWLQTDLLTRHWDVGQLAHDVGLTPQDVFVGTAPISDPQLAARYTVSDVTLAPGLGEGFGYPLVESLACGTPVIHGHFAGGVVHVPRPNWLISPIAWRLESCYALKRPVFNPRDWAVAAMTAAGWKRQDRRLVAAYCAGSVAHLNWAHLWPRWRGWIETGLQEIRGGGRVIAA
jgi:glycosyltransferase involved in cell wall biosynthesis